MTDEFSLPRYAKGKRPAFFQEDGVDHLLAMVLELATELSVAHARADRLEQYLAQTGQLEPAAPEAFESGAGLVGAQDRRATGTTGPGSNSHHILTTIDVRVDGGDTATSDSYFIFLVETNVSPKIFNCGHYQDTWVRTPSGWKLRVRDIVLG